MTWQVEQASEASHAPYNYTSLAWAISSRCWPFLASTCLRVPSLSLKLNFTVLMETALWKRQARANMGSLIIINAVIIIALIKIKINWTITDQVGDKKRPGISTLILLNSSQLFNSKCSDNNTLKLFIGSQMKNKRKYAKSSERDSSFDGKTKPKPKSKKDPHSNSVIYESARHSQGAASPRPSKGMQKYRTYIQFISNNQMNNQHLRVEQQELARLKKVAGMTPMPRKNSPVPYARGRKSAMAKFTQPPSPRNLIYTHRSELPRSLPHETKKQNNRDVLFVVRGSNIDAKQPKEKPGRNSVQIEKGSRKGHMKQLSRGDETTGETQIKSHRNHPGAAQKSRENKKAPKNSAKAAPKTSENDKLDQQQAKLCEKLFQGVQFYRDLGKGAHALVRSAVDWNNKRKIAVKIYDKSTLSEQQVRSIERQIQILMSLSHSNIIKLYEIIQTFKTINLMMEYGGGNSLDQYIKSKPEGYLNQKQAKHIFKQVAQAVAYLHDMNVTHRDIKSENILLNKHLNLKIIDFGFSLVVGQANKNINSYCGTPTYMAPEVVSKIPHNPQLADRWSMGVLLFAMLNGMCPFRANTQKQLFVKINKGEYEYMRAVNPLARDLIGKLLARAPNERLSPKDVLEHAWFNHN